MSDLDEHYLTCIRQVMEAAARATQTVDGEFTLASWDAYLDGAARRLIQGPCSCHFKGALLVIWLLARRQYASPEEFIGEIGTILATVVLGEVT